MSTWHITPEYINECWTEEQFLLLFIMRNKRIRHESGKTNSTDGKGKKLISTHMTDKEFFARSGAEITVVKEEKPN